MSDFTNTRLKALSRSSFVFPDLFLRFHRTSWHWMLLIIKTRVNIDWVLFLACKYLHALQRRNLCCVVSFTWSFTMISDNVASLFCKLNGQILYSGILLFTKITRCRCRNLLEWKICYRTMSLIKWWAPYPFLKIKYKSIKMQYFCFFCLVQGVSKISQPVNWRSKNRL